LNERHREQVAEIMRTESTCSSCSAEEPLSLLLRVDVLPDCVREAPLLDDEPLGDSRRPVISTWWFRC